MSSAGGATWVDGVVIRADSPAVAADDHGLTLGDGVYETLLVRDRRPLFWDRHLARLSGALCAAHIRAVAEERLRTAAREVMAAAELDDCRLRITVTSGRAAGGLGRGRHPTVIATASALGAPPGPAHVLRVPWVRNERSALAGVKSTSCGEAAAIHAHVEALGADTAVLGDTAGRLSESLTANVFVAVDGRLLTPSLASGCLPGIVRALLLEAGVGEEAELDLSSLDGAAEAFLTSSVVGVRPVGFVDGLPLPTVDGPATGQARQAVGAAERADAARTPGADGWDP